MTQQNEISRRAQGTPRPRRRRPLTALRQQFDTCSMERSWANGYVPSLTKGSALRRTCRCNSKIELNDLDS